MNRNDGRGDSSGSHFLWNLEDLSVSQQTVLRPLSLPDFLTLWTILHQNDPDFMPDDSWADACIPV